jgi:hypothetical protein
VRGIRAQWSGGRRVGDDVAAVTDNLPERSVFDFAWYLEVLRQKPLSGRYLSVCGQRRRRCDSLY